MVVTISIMSSSELLTWASRRVVVVVLHDYPRQFVAFYSPKSRALWGLFRRALDQLQASDDINAAIDFTASLVVVVSIYHLVESFRVAAVKRLRHAYPPTVEDKQ